MRLTTSIVLVLCVAGCGGGLRRFPLAAPRWQDPDRNHVPEMPAPHYSGLYGDAIDQTFLRPLSDVLAVRAPGEALNVNALDEVPNSSWFQNRIGLFPMTPAEAARGPCTDPPLDPKRGPWIVTSAKTEGVTPGFFVKAPDGHRYLLKMDGEFRPERASTADVVGSLIYHAAGYNTPCNEVVFFRRAILERAPDATREDDLGREQPLTAADVDRVLRRAVRLKDGRLRALASRFLPGKPLGPFRYEGVREDDPNDVIPHQDRRDLRASGLLAAWLNHFDIREQNSLDMWVEQDGRRFVRHYQLDFGDSFAAPWTDRRLDVRVGHAYYMDLGQIGVDLVTLGIHPRPWYHATINSEAEIFGHYGWKDFVPSKWKPIYPNPAFSRMTWRDALWIVRIIARFGDAHLAAIVARARLRDDRAARYLVRALSRRRDLILREYLSRHVPLDRFRIIRRTPGESTQSLCFEDLAIRHAVVPAGRVVYKLRMVAGERLGRELGWLQFRPDPDHPTRSCIQLPLGDTRPAALAPAGARDDHPRRYGVLRVLVYQRSRRPTRVDLHLYDLGATRGHVLVGIERHGAQREPP